MRFKLGPSRVTHFKFVQIACIFVSVAITFSNYALTPQKYTFSGSNLPEEFKNALKINIGCTPKRL